MKVQVSKFLIEANVEFERIENEGGTTYNMTIHPPTLSDSGYPVDPTLTTPFRVALPSNSDMHQWLEGNFQRVSHINQSLEVENAELEDLVAKISQRPPHSETHVIPGD